MTGPGRPNPSITHPSIAIAVAAWAPTAGRSHMTKSSVIPTGAERSEAQRRDLFCCSDCTKRSLGCAAPLGGFARDDGINSQTRWPCLQRGTSGVAEIAENKFYVAKSAAEGAEPSAEMPLGAPLRWGSIPGRAAKAGQFKSGKCLSPSSTPGSRRRRTAPAAICSRAAWR